MAGAKSRLALSRQAHRGVGERCCSLREKLHVDGRKITVVPNGVPLDGTPDTSVQNTPPLVVTTAQLRAHKGHEYLLQAARELPDVRFLFVGEGPEREQLERSRARSASTIGWNFLGFRSDVRELFAAAT